MIKKILLIFITIFAFSNISAQSNIVIEHTGCAGDVINELEYIGVLNGKNHYQRLTTPTALGDSFGAAGGTTNVYIAFNGTDWVLYQNLITNVIFIQEEHITGLLPPDTGWYGVLCPVSSFIEVLSGGVLGVEKEFLGNKVNIFPNPTADFISVSNINEITSLKITNITGQTVIRTQIDQNNSQVSVKDLSKGFYFVEIGGKKTIKLIKK